MKSYELTLVLAGDASSAKKKSVSEKLEKVLKTFKGKIAKADDWGKIDLSYPIAKKTSGNFLFFELEMEGASAKPLNQKLKLEDDIMRHLLIRKD